jgi:hypothetical protein
MRHDRMGSVSKLTRRASDTSGHHGAVGAERLTVMRVHVLTVEGGQPSLWLSARRQRQHVDDLCVRPELAIRVAVTS